MYNLCIKNGTIVTEDKTFQGNIYVTNDKIEKIDDSQMVILPSETVIDANGKYVFPGFIDPHVHLNDPGLTESEDFYTGTASAAAGGITTVLEHPLTFPLPSDVEALSQKRDIGNAKAVVDFCLWGALTPDNYEQVDDMIDWGVIAFKAFMPYSVEIPQVNDGELLKHMRQLGERDILLGIHCENDAIVRTCTDEARKEGLTSVMDYEKGRPVLAEVEAATRVCLLAEESKCKAHVVHCSSKGAVDVVNRFRNKGVDVSVETCSHYFRLNQDHLHDLGAFGICNPPIRSKLMMVEIEDLILKGQIDFVGSDHATYTFEEKEIIDNDIFTVPAGLTGIQTVFPLLYQLRDKGLSLNDFVKLSSTNAAKRFKLYPKKGCLQVGSDADITILDPNTTYEINEDHLLYKMKWSPYMGYKLKGKVDYTIVRGEVVYDGHIKVKPGYGQFVKGDHR
ncbi:allantoinase AllB [Acidaminobacter sp. JC074]|uniref:allantoinase AllB n=1 Tax=Acidaminobacter sp. JC074 TaxID=2530199 RepID=UPI001F0DD17E|nr:allantoinase AllB [Acidaminobacter sp. JC074]MCH4886399.1 allantoinase AllB [Acidaminobacter sp. JC074]